MRYVLGWMLVVGLLLIAASVQFPAQTLAQESTVTPATTARVTPTFTPPAIEPFIFKVFNDIDFTSYDLNSIAVDADDNVYVPDSNRYIHVFTADFDEFRRIPVVQPVSVAFNQARDVLLVGRRYPASIEQYTPEGKTIGKLWSASNTVLDCIGVDRQDMIYAIYKSTSAPFPRSMVKLDPKGNIIFVRELFPLSLDEDIIYAMTFEPNGTMNVTASGFGRDPILLSFWQYSPAGDRLLGLPRAFFTTILLRPPGHPLRLADGTLVMYNGDGLGWWRPDANQIAFNYWIETVGGPTRQGTKHGGIALSADGQTVFYADVTEANKLVLGKTRLARS